MDDRNAGLALFQGAIALLIPAAIGYVVFRLVKPSTNFWESSPSNYGRLWLAYTLGLLFFALTSLAIIQPAGLGIAEVLVITPIYTIPSGIVSYLLGYFYGKSKSKEVNAVKKPKTINKAGIEKPVNKSIKKTVEKPQELKTEKNIPNNKTMDEENSEDINDEEYYLMVTKETEGLERDEALWAKAMATQMGDEIKAKSYYVNKRVAILKTLEKKIRQEVYVTIGAKYSTTSEVPENDLSTDNLFPNSPNDHYRKQMINKFEQKVKERLEKEFN
jgi:hypothetical protein